MHHDAKKLIAVDSRRQFLCQDGGGGVSMGHRNLLATSFDSRSSKNMDRDTMNANNMYVQL